MLHTYVDIRILIFLLLFSYKVVHTEDGWYNEDDDPMASSFKIKLRQMDALEYVLQDNSLTNWMYNDKIDTLEKLGIVWGRASQSILNHHPMSKRLQRTLSSALRGNDLQMAVLGGSISAGAMLVNGNQEHKVYYNVFADWWNRVIFPAVGSRMSVRSSSLGAIGTDFFALCYKNFLSTETNLVLWELAVNDFKRYEAHDFPPTQPLEHLTRNLLKFKPYPAIIYISFFRGKDFILEGNCENLENDGMAYISKYYEVPLISWRRLVCGHLMTHQQTYFRHIFSEDNLHPSTLGHAQMAYLLIEYYRAAFLSLIRDLRASGNAHRTFVFIQSMSLNGLLRGPIYMHTAKFAKQPLCYTLNVPSDGIPPENDHAIQVEEAWGYHIRLVHGKQLRRDQTRGLVSVSAGRNVTVRLDLPRSPYDDRGLREWTILIGSFSGYGSAQVFLDGKRTITVNTNRYPYGYVVVIVAKRVPPGKHTLVIHSLVRGFVLSSVMAS